MSDADWQPGQVLSAAAIVSPRSATCGAACRRSPCVLRQIQYAKRELDSEPLLVVWAELSVVAHLVGEPMPVPRAWVLDALSRFDPRHRECTFSHAVDRAVDVRRWTANSTPAGAASLAIHVNDAMNYWVNTDRKLCDAREDPLWKMISSPTEIDHELIIFGHTRPSWLERAVGGAAGGADWGQRLELLLHDFVATSWIGALVHESPEFAVGGR